MSEYQYYDQAVKLLVDLRDLAERTEGGDFRQRLDAIRQMHARRPAFIAGLEADAIQGRAGKQSWGYVEPTEAAWELLEEAVDDVVADMKRRMELGLDAAAEAICCGIPSTMHLAASTGTLCLAGRSLG